jgi:hypothetical protein
MKNLLMQTALESAKIIGLWSLVMVVVGVIAYQFDSGSSLWSYGPILVIVAGVVGVIVHAI